MRNGAYFGLCPKSYILTDRDEDGKISIKKGAKGKNEKSFTELNINLGVPRAAKLTESAYRECLFEGQPFEVEVNSLMLNREKNMCRIKSVKRGLSDIVTKVVVNSDRVTCSPLQKNGKLV